MIGELVTGICLARAAWGTAALLKLNSEFGRAAWPVITHASDAIVRTNGGLLTCTELQGNCKAIAFHGPERHVQSPPIYITVNHIMIPMWTGGVDVEEGDVELSCLTFNIPHNPQTLFNFTLEDFKSLKSGVRSRHINSDAEYKRTLGSWNIPDNMLLNIVPRPVKEVEFDRPLFCVSSPKYSGICSEKHKLRMGLLLNNRCSLFFTSCVVGLLGILF